MRGRTWSGDAEYSRAPAPTSSIRTDLRAERLTVDFTGSLRGGALFVGFPLGFWLAIAASSVAKPPEGGGGSVGRNAIESPDGRLFLPGGDGHVTPLCGGTVVRARGCTPLS